jgi:hypothetical protein
LKDAKVSKKPIGLEIAAARATARDDLGAGWEALEVVGCIAIARALADRSPRASTEQRADVDRDRRASSCPSRARRRRDAGSARSSIMLSSLKSLWTTVGLSAGDARHEPGGGASIVASSSVLARCQLGPTVDLARRSPRLPEPHRRAGDRHWMVGERVDRRDADAAPHRRVVRDLGRHRPPTTTPWRRSITKKGAPITAGSSHNTKTRGAGA